MKRHRLFDSFLDRVEADREERYIREYAMDGGTLDSQLAGHIRMELRRRNEMGKELDIYEPLRWAVAKIGISAGAGAGVMLTRKQPVTRAALGALTATTALSAAIDLLRLYPRFKAGLHGGVDVAIAMDALEKQKNLNWSQRIVSPSSDSVARAI